MRQQEIAYQHHYSAECVRAVFGRKQAKGKFFKAYAEQTLARGRSIIISGEAQIIIDCQEFEQKKGEYLVSTYIGLFRLRPTSAIWQPK